jgi:tetratricopeptide (TPR) repeat protein
VQHHHATALVSVHNYAAVALQTLGDLHGCIARRHQGYDLCARTGDIKHGSWALTGIGACFLALGDLEQAEEYMRRALEIHRQTDMKRNVAGSMQQIGIILQSRGALEAAEDAFKEAVSGFHEIGYWGERNALAALGRCCLRQGRREEAVQRFQEALALSAADGAAVATALSGLEAALEDADAFRALCERFRAEHPGAGDPPLIQWYLEPTQAMTDERPPVLAERFLTSLAPGWVWHEPAGGCTLVVQEGLEIHAANGQDLWQMNLRAPRLLRPVSGDFAAQTVCASATPEKPAIGGLLLWKDARNYLRLGKGGRGSHEISLEGCLAGKHAIFGRGCLPSERVFLRFERQGHRVTAVCSADGEQWYGAGGVEFPVEEAPEVGLHAIGSIDRTIYPGAYPEGTAIRFESFQLWR